jgi:hypothetical protein
MRKRLVKIGGWEPGAPQPQILVSPKFRRRSTWATLMPCGFSVAIPFARTGCSRGFSMKWRNIGASAKTKSGDRHCIISSKSLFNTWERRNKI